MASIVICVIITIKSHLADITTGLNRPGMVAGTARTGRAAVACPLRPHLQHHTGHLPALTPTPPPLHMPARGTPAGPAAAAYRARIAHGRPASPDRHASKNSRSNPPARCASSSARYPVPRFRLHYLDSAAPAQLVRLGWAGLGWAGLAWSTAGHAIVSGVPRVVHMPYAVEQDEDSGWCASTQPRRGVGAVGDGWTREAAIADLREAVEVLLAETGAALPVGTEERGQVGDEQFGFFQRGEVAPGRHLGPARDGIQPFRP